MYHLLYSDQGTPFNENRMPCIVVIRNCEDLYTYRVIGLDYWESLAIRSLMTRVSLF